MAKLFNVQSGGGMAAYNSVFAEDKDANGIRSQLADKTTIIDEIWEDRQPYDDDDMDEDFGPLVPAAR